MSAKCQWNVTKGVWGGACVHVCVHMKNSCWLNVIVCVCKRERGEVTSEGEFEC